MIEKDYVIEIPSNFVENSKPGTGNGDTPTTPGEGENTDPSDPVQPEESTDVTITLTVPAKGSKGNLTFHISAFIRIFDTNNSFKLYVKDKNGKDDTATIKLTKK